MNLKLLLFFQLKQKNFINNNEYPNCKDCFYFKEHPDPYNKYHLGKCTLFGDKDNVSGEINYMYAKTCRDFNQYCGRKGKYYINKIE